MQKNVHIFYTTESFVIKVVLAKHAHENRLDGNAIVEEIMRVLEMNHDEQTRYFHDVGVANQRERGLDRTA